MTTPVHPAEPVAECYRCHAKLRWEREGGEWNPRTGDADVAIRCLDCASLLCGPCARGHFNESVGSLEAWDNPCKGHCACQPKWAAGYITACAELRRTGADLDAARAEAASLRERVARLKNELLGVAQDIDGDCVCDVDGCECGGDGSVCGEALEAGCVRCWATRLRQVAEGVDWPPRVLEERR